ncbi:MAG: acyl-CoA/acyl-ACP dehydrogenase [Chlorobia bacterium]|nr:acyl-CoA/acyl-ACP dehydrogenase [Fimbriimonadaceae bacterium]
MDSILQNALQYLHDEVRPQAQEIDLSVDALRQALDGLCSRDLMALKRPAEYGGPALTEESFRVFQEETARVSGALAFLQTQHQSAVSMIAKSENSELKGEYLPKMANGEKLVGIGFSQLRRPGPPVMRAVESDGGYLLTGHVPWITGWSFYPEFLIGATLPDGSALFAVVPLADSDSQGTIRISEPMELAAMGTAMTVTADFDGWFVPSSLVAFIKPTGWIQNNDMINIALQGHFALGCALGALDVLKAAADKRGFAFLHDVHGYLSQELADCKVETELAQKGPESDSNSASGITEQRLNVRAWAIDLAVRCAHASVTASSGAANSLKHPAQRIYREALVYTVSAQTTPIMEATLKRLTRLNG